MKFKTINRIRKTGRILMIAFALVFAASYAAGSMLEDNADQVNNFLGTKNTTLKNVGDYDSYTADYKNTSELVEAHEKIGTRLGEEGSVLLKNSDSALPLSTSDEKVTLLGFRSTADYAIYGMDIGSMVEPSQNVTFEDALTETGFDVNETVCDAYNTAAATYASSNSYKLRGVDYTEMTIGTGHSFNVAEIDIDDVKAAASGGESAFDSSINAYNDAAIVVIGRPSSEGGDYYLGDTGRDSSQFTQSASQNVLSLSDEERDLLSYAKSNFKKVIVVVSTASAMELGDLESDDGIDAILWIGYPGNYGFLGVSNILAGNANPSGRLADTYAADGSVSPAMMNFGEYSYSNSSSYGFDSIDPYAADKYVVQAEGIYVGYKYYETRYEDTVLGQGNASGSTSTKADIGAYATNSSVWNYTDEVTYAFGYGLSYTTYTQKINEVTFSSDYKTAYVTVAVTNDGSVDGKSVIQVYGQSPYTEYDEQYGVEKASVQLLAYDKIDVSAGTTETVTVEVDMQNLASYDSNGAKSYIMEKTTSGGSEHYYFALGCNPNDGTEGAHSAVNNILAVKGYTPDNSSMDAAGYSAAVYEFDWTAPENTFSTSKAGVTVTNQLDDVDYNYYDDDTVTYLSRSNWTGTWPKSYTGLSITSDMVSVLENDYYEVSTDDDTDGIFGVEVSEDDYVYFSDMFGSDFDDERWDTLLSEISIEEAVRYTASGNRSFYQIESIKFITGFSYTENGSVGIEKSLSQQSDDNSPSYVASNDEYADYDGGTFGSPVLMASTWDQDLMEEIGELWGNDALFMNIPMVWAPSINVHRTPYNGRNGDYYSEDGVLSGYSALRVSQGALSKGLVTSIKHFAFNTQETFRLGISTYMNEQSARENELRGFQIALEGDYDSDGNRSSALGIMTAYNRVGATYSGGHTGLMQNILRGEWDFNGYATSDLVRANSTYMPYIESMMAGTTNYDGTISSSTDQTTWKNISTGSRYTVSDLVELVSGDADLLNSIKENLHYSLYMFSQSNLANWMTEDTVTGTAMSWWRVAYNAGEIISGIFVCGGLIVYITAEVLDVIFKKRGYDRGDDETEKEENHES